MDKDADEAVEELKKLLRAGNDAELARALKLDKRTVSAWRARKRVPQRYIEMLNGQSSAAVAVGPVYWSYQEQAAFSLTLFRYSRSFQNEFNCYNISQALRVLSSSSDDFWALMKDAQRDLMNVDMSNSPGSALAVLIHEDMKSPKETDEKCHRAMQENRPSVEWQDGSVTDPSGKPLRYPQPWGVGKIAHTFKKPPLKTNTFPKRV
jgi:hypothetical protein